VVAFSLIDRSLYLKLFRPEKTTETMKAAVAIAEVAE
jgi:hypothetical protein